MIHKVTVTLFFPDPGVALALYNHALGVIAQAITINSGEPNEELSQITLEECGHDETPQVPCTILQHAQTPSIFSP